MSLTLLTIYNDVAGQAWSMFDGEVEDEDEFESSLLSSIQKALSDLWNKYPYPFREGTYSFNTIANTNQYELPNGNIIKRNIDGENKYCIKILNGKYLSFIEDYTQLDDAVGTPESFYIKGDKICLYPTPNDVIQIDVDYLKITVGKNTNGDDIFTLKNDDDYIDIPTKYEELFRNALITLSMIYGIASETNRNYNSYKLQADTAYKNLVKFTKGIDKNSRISW